MKAIRIRERADGLLITYEANSVGVRWLGVARRDSLLDAADADACFDAYPETVTMGGHTVDRGTRDSWRPCPVSGTIRMPGDDATIERLLETVPIRAIPDTPIDPATARALAKVADRLEGLLRRHVESGGTPLTGEGALALVLSALHGTAQCN